MAKFSLFALVFMTIAQLVATLNLDPKITALAQDWRTEAVVAGILFSSLLAVSLISGLAQAWKTQIDEIKSSRDLDRRIRQLKPKDKLVLSRFVEGEKLTVELNPEEPSVAWLESLKLIHRSSEATSGSLVAYRIALHAMDLFTRQPNLLR